MMTEKHWLYVNMGGIIAFALFLVLSFATIQTDATQNVMIWISEIVGGLLLIAAIISLFYMKSNQKFVPIAILTFLIPWVLFTIGYELGFNEDTSNVWIWFISLYILLIANFILLRISYSRIEGYNKLIPASLLFVQAIFFVFLAFFQVWWLLPF
ncbi:hypothetical protein EQV77_11580 [Halobacillus fulvus]|nr:hypothetical protein EQV77_11580 [Halobacillus fulvus]